MWYFSWMLGLPLAAAFAILNAMWYELMDDQDKGLVPPPRSAPPATATQPDQR